MGGTINIIKVSIFFIQEHLINIFPFHIGPTIHGVSVFTIDITDTLMKSGGVINIPESMEKTIKRPKYANKVTSEYPD